MDISQLPQEVLAYLPDGHEPDDGLKLVLPLDDGSELCIASVNRWIRAEPPYPTEFEPVVWVGADGVGNLLGWDTSQRHAILWNPHDERPFWSGGVTDLWQFILGGYGQAA